MKKTIYDLGRQWRISLHEERLAILKVPDDEAIDEVVDRIADEGSRARKRLQRRMLSQEPLTTDDLRGLLDVAEGIYDETSIIDEDARKMLSKVCLELDRVARSPWRERVEQMRTDREHAEALRNMYGQHSVN
jgi:hypothetical protein